MHVLRELLALLHELLLSAEELQHLLRAGLTVLVQLLQSDKTQTDETNSTRLSFTKVFLAWLFFNSMFWILGCLLREEHNWSAISQKICQNLLSVKGSFSQSEYLTDYHLLKRDNAPKNENLSIIFVIVYYAASNIWLFFLVKHKNRNVSECLSWFSIHKK